MPHARDTESGPPVPPRVRGMGYIVATNRTRRARAAAPDAPAVDAPATVDAPAAVDAPANPRYDVSADAPAGIIRTGNGTWFNVRETRYRVDVTGMDVAAWAVDTDAGRAAIAAISPDGTVAIMRESANGGIMLDAFAGTDVSNPARAALAIAAASWAVSRPAYESRAARSHVGDVDVACACGFGRDVNGARTCAGITRNRSSWAYGERDGICVDPTGRIVDAATARDAWMAWGTARAAGTTAPDA